MIAVEAAAAAAERPQPVVDRAEAVQADRDREPVLLEELAVVVGQLGAVGGDRERDARRRARAAERAGALGGGAEHRAVEQRLAAEEGEVDPLAGARRRANSRSTDASAVSSGMFVAGAAEAAALRVAVGAAEVALLRDGERQRADRRLGRRLCRRRTRGASTPRRASSALERSSSPLRAGRSSCARSASSTSYRRLPLGTSRCQPVAAVDQVGVGAAAGADSSNRSVMIAALRR